MSGDDAVDGGRGAAGRRILASAPCAARGGTGGAELGAVVGVGRIIEAQAGIGGASRPGLDIAVLQDTDVAGRASGPAGRSLIQVKMAAVGRPSDRVDQAGGCARAAAGVIDAGAPRAARRGGGRRGRARSAGDRIGAGRSGAPSPSTIGVGADAGAEGFGYAVVYAAGAADRGRRRRDRPGCVVVAGRGRRVPAHAAAGHAPVGIASARDARRPSAAAAGGAGRRGSARRVEAGQDARRGRAAGSSGPAGPAGADIGPMDVGLARRARAAVAAMPPGRGRRIGRIG